MDEYHYFGSQDNYVKAWYIIIIIKVYSLPLQPVTPSTPSSAASVFPQDWVAIENDDCSSLDKISRQSTTFPLPKQQRTHSSPLLDSRNTTRPHKMVIMTREILTESCRSVSDPDLTSSTDKERCSTSSGEVDMENPMGDQLAMREESLGRKDKPPYKVRYSDNSLERPEVNQILDRLESISDTVLLPGERGGSANGGVGTGKWRSVLLKQKNKHRHHKDIQRIKKTSKTFHSSEDILEQSSSMDREKEGRRSSSGSPQEVHSPIPKKKTSTSIFKLSKRKKHALSLHAPSTVDSPSAGGGGGAGGAGGGGKDKSNSPPAQSSSAVSNFDGAQIISNEFVSGPLLDGGEDVSPKHHVVSFPVHAEKESKVQAATNFNLQTLIQPANKNWVKCGYLWLRMKLPNGRYAWTHIVS